MFTWRKRQGPVATLVVGALLCAILLTFPGEAMAQDPPTLYWGSSGPWVSDVQARLRNWGYYNGPVDAVFGAKVHNAVVAFQRRNGLVADGVVGPQTYRALGIWVSRAPSPATQAAPATTSSTNYSPRSSDLDMLSRLVRAEAGGEPYEGQVAVAAVMLNRVRSPNFPNTLAGVVYQPLAFESVQVGTIYQSANAENIRAAQDALNGWDPTYGSLYFWAYKKRVNPWVWTRQVVRYIGDHVFAR